MRCKTIDQIQIHVLHVRNSSKYMTIQYKNFKKKYYAYYAYDDLKNLNHNKSC